MKKCSPSGPKGTAANLEKVPEKKKTQTFETKGLEVGGLATIISKMVNLLDDDKPTLTKKTSETPKTPTYLKMRAVLDVQTKRCGFCWGSFCEKKHDGSMAKHFHQKSFTYLKSRNPEPSFSNYFWGWENSPKHKPYIIMLTIGFRIPPSIFGT